MDSKIFYVNFDVGSAIQYAGEIFHNWIKESIEGTNIECINCTGQDQSYHLFDKMLDANPTLIVLNETFTKSIEAALFYKRVYPDTKIFYIPHVWQEFWFIEDSICQSEKRGISHGHSIYEWIKYKEFFYNMTDEIMIVNYKPDGNFMDGIVNKVHNFHYPTDPSIFKVTRPWDKREKIFFGMGNILPHKLSFEFVKKFSHPTVKLDYFGFTGVDLSSRIIKRTNGGALELDGKNGTLTASEIVRDTLRTPKGITLLLT